MSADRHDRIGELFLAARGLAGEERSIYLDDACGADTELRSEVESLLAHDDDSADEKAGSALARGLHELESEHGVELRPESIGGYRIVARIGSGGMGVVYEAEQLEPERRVALKVIRPGFATPTTLRRFRYEAQVLGWLDHPGIARIYEAGTDDTGAGEQPWFAMELVQGVSLTSYAERHGLDLRARLELLTQVCDAVRHAHQKGVIHRDLKPANVLVDQRGQPKVLDFGVARATDADLRPTVETLTGQIVGTLAYMSPEQVAGKREELDTRSDVYALGVIAYELLAGTCPHDVADAPLHEAARIVIEEEPTRLGERDPRLRGDVETIVARAMEKDKSRRYASAGELAADVRRFLCDEPITARPPSALYQLHKFARRNRVLVGGAAAVILALAAGVVVSTGLYLDAQEAWAAETSERVRAQAAEQVALDEAAAVEEVSEFLVGLFALSDASGDNWGETVTARELLDTGHARFVGAFEQQPRLRSRMAEAMGRVYGNLGFFPDSEQLLTDALAAQRELHGDADHLDVARCLRRLASLRLLQADFERAERRFVEALEMTARIDPEHDSLADLFGALANARLDQARYDEAERALERAMKRTRAAHGDDSIEMTHWLASLAEIVWARGDYERAYELEQRVLAIRRAGLDPESPLVVDALNSLGLHLVRRNREREAEPILREAFEIRARRLPVGHPDRLASMNNLGLALLDLGQLEEARELFADALVHVRQRFGERNRRTILALHNLANTERARGDQAQAERLFREAIDLSYDVGDELTPVHAACLNNLALLLAMEKNDGRGAEELLREALEIEREIAPDDIAAHTNTLGNLAMALQVQGRFEEAEPLLLEVLAQNRELYGPSEQVASILNNLGVLRARRGDLEGAVDTLSECLGVLSTVFPGGHASTASVHASLGAMTRERGELERAADHFHAAVEVSLATLPEGHPATTARRIEYGRCLMALERFDEAEVPLVAAYEELGHAEGPDGSRARSVSVQLRAVAEALGRPQRLAPHFE